MCYNRAIEKIVPIYFKDQLKKIRVKNIVAIPNVARIKYADYITSSFVYSGDNETVFQTKLGH